MWSWDAFFSILTSRQLLEGAWVTIWLTVVSMILGLVLAVVVAAARSSRLTPLRAVSGFYVWLMRGTPLLVQLVIIYTGLPQVGIKLGVIEAALLGLVLNEAAYLSEIVRSGLMSVPTGQTEAARALGMSPAKVFRVVVLPQAMRVMIPPLGNSFNGLLKTTTLVSVISVQELLRRTQFLVQVNFRVLEGLIAAALYFLVLTTLWGLIQKMIEVRVGRGYDRNYKRKTRDDRKALDASAMEAEAVNR
ncbi:amino acid ABC transporter permease [Rhodococcus sp. BP-252]|uniref:ABC transporter permease n=1 Tax=Rhodococcoides kyotonense TaxID=398843 RepID=A0A177Y6L3_9NOCA|nr:MULTISPECIES: amino acid ABC transporter permease [Rhodococcus]MBY6410399.1 amino acid ABC transporter permease [Rhodococcus sp. BP-320]MBY6416281.1 amino acid ABC transporter permease [Rhodococcus sp. BP-321]MBY6420276.1 amino acid ABC transporter permease [Rhodococcus sp. BP-324]MBY6424955.1 amino acid ABC transporter permease [Rhodococcus sp. BP-323]MBY6430339.1 amino acid ABC transporter permease [Rhodococcus sp. BP-322]